MNLYLNGDKRDKNVVRCIELESIATRTFLRKYSLEDFQNTFKENDIEILKRLGILNYYSNKKIIKYPIFREEICDIYGIEKKYLKPTKTILNSKEF